MLNEQKLNQVVDMVTTALEDGITLQLGKSFADTNDFSVVEQVVIDAFGGAVDAVEDFDMTVQAYLLARLEDDSCDKALPQISFEDEKKAEDDGYWWFDELDRWIWLP